MFLPSQESDGGAAAKRVYKRYKLRVTELAARAHGTSQNDERLAMVFDLGRGTLDVSLVDVGGRTASHFASLD